MQNAVPVRLALGLKSSAQALRSSRSPVARGMGFALSAVYRSVSLYLLGFDVPTSTRMERGVILHHTVGLVIHDQARIERGVRLRQNTTVGSRHDGGGAPRLCEGADVGANCVILGDVRIGRYAVIGAGSVVLRDVPDGATVVGNPAREVQRVAT